MALVHVTDGPPLHTSRLLKRVLEAASITQADVAAEVLDDVRLPALALVIDREVVLACHDGVRRWDAGELARVDGERILAPDGTPLPIGSWSYPAQRDALLGAVRALLGQEPALPVSEAIADQPAGTSVLERCGAGGLVVLILIVLTGTLGWAGSLSLNGFILFAYKPLLILPALGVAVGLPVLVAATFPARGSMKPLLALLAAACSLAGILVAIDAIQAHRQDERLLEATHALAGLEGDKDGLHVVIRRHSGDGNVELVVRTDQASAARYPEFSTWNGLFCQTPRTQVVFADGIASATTETRGVFPYERASL